MPITDKLRRRTSRLIQADSVQVTIRRRVQVSRPAGGVTTEKITLPPQTVRVYRKGRSDSVAEPGAVGLIQAWSLLAFHDADITAGDEFELSGRGFRVRAAWPETLRGSTVAVSADVEEVGRDAGF